MSTYTHYESDVMQEVYDHIFQNHTMMDFCEEYPESWIDCDNATLYLAKNEGVALFKIKIERVKT